MQVIDSAGLINFQPDMLMVMDSAACQKGADALGQFLDRYTPDRGLFAKDSAAATGGAFVQGELEKPDFNLVEPLSNFTWPRDIPYVTGGGFVDYTSNFFVDYATHGANQYGLMGVDTNNLPTIQANVTKDLYKVFRFGYLVKIPLISQRRFEQVGRSIENLLQNGLRLNYDLMLNDNAYKGLDPVGTKGLLNQSTTLNTGSESTVLLKYASADGSGSSRKWANKTPSQILSDLDGLLEAIWAHAEYSPVGLPNHVGLPPAEYARLNREVISTAGSVSILTYLKENNIVTAQGGKLEIVPMRQTIDAGTALVSGETSSGRVVAYRNEESCLHFDETVPLTRVITQPDANSMSYISGYVSSVGQLKLLRYQTIGYMDGIS